MKKIGNFLHEWGEAWQLPVWVILMMAIFFLLALLGIPLSGASLGNLSIGFIALGLMSIGSFGTWFIYRTIFGTFSKYSNGKLQGVSFKDDFVRCPCTFRIAFTVGSTLVLLLCYCLLCNAVV